MSDTPQSPKPEPAPKPETSTSFWAELKRRKVTRVAITYALVAWIVIQIAVATFPSLLIPQWALTLVIMCVLLGFPVALIITWAFELTPDGIKTTKAARIENSVEPVSKKQQRKRNRMAFAFAAGLPTLIFGSLAVFFYLRSGISDPAVISSQSSDHSSLPASEDKSIAVLPLINMSADEDNRFFADGVHEDILTGLTALEGFKVFSRTTMLRFATSDKTLPEIGREIDSRYIVEGSVRKIGNHVRITIQLIDAENDHHIWASNFDRELVDIFATQTELASEISNSIHLELQPETVKAIKGLPTENALAYDLYQKAESIEKTEGETESSSMRRRKLLEQAVQEDPNFVEAWGQLKRLYDIMQKRIRQGRPWSYGATDMDAFVEDLKTRSLQALTKATTLDPNNVETLLASIINHIEPQPPEVLAERKKVFERVLKDHPDYPMALLHYGWWHMHVDDLNGMKVYFEKALEADPFNARIVEALIYLYGSKIEDPDRKTELVMRLEQIVPETAEARLKARQTVGFQAYSAWEAFRASADKRFLQELKSALEQIDSSKISYEWRYLVMQDEANLHAVNRDLGALAEIASQMEVPGDVTNRDWNPNINVFFDVNSMSMCGFKLAGRDSEAESVARRMIVASQLPQISEYEFFRQQVQPCIAIAHSILGENEAARKVASKLEAFVDSLEGDQDDKYYRWNRSRATVAWTWVDSDHAAVRFLKANTNREKEELASLLGYIATKTNVNAPLLTHPKIQALFVEDGKWIDYLAEHFPEYAALRDSKK